MGEFIVSWLGVSSEHGRRQDHPFGLGILDDGLVVGVVGLWHVLGTLGDRGLGRSRALWLARCHGLD